MSTPLSIANPAVLAENISVHFNRSKHYVGSVKEFSIQLLKKKVVMEKIKALDGISLQIQRGEVYGIIGRNGSGKSTMLRVLSRIILPTEGRLRIWGKVSPLLGVGAGFHQELTGRENVFIYSAVLGRSTARTKELLDSIVEFSELEDFIDEPIRVYSSGMVARLGFAVAMAERPEILLVDEVLSVGDERFKDKCNARFHELTAGGTTIIFVSHNMGAVQELCSRASWINQGKLMMTGITSDVISEYKKSLGKK
jgi:ABC-type polysaccharide/polyol phosphate transport system ATPase subunit